jgi:hypothetical protein
MGMRPAIRLLLPALAGVVAAATAEAAPTRVALGKAMILYDSAVWRAATAGDGTITFTCIAPDCPGQPHVFASLTNVRELSTSLAAARRDGRTIRDNAVPPLPFPALSYSSGCRSPDAPILFAGGQVGEEAYRFTTAILTGCNFNSALPEARFTDLVRGLETN